MIYLCLYPVLIIQSQNYKMVCLISAADNIYPAKNFLQLQTDKLQKPVTCILSKQIIDKLKILNIDIDNSGICLRMLLQKFPASPVKSFFIKKSGQFIRLHPAAICFLRRSFHLHLCPVSVINNHKYSQCHQKNQDTYDLISVFLHKFPYGKRFQQIYGILPDNIILILTAQASDALIDYRNKIGVCVVPVYHTGLCFGKNNSRQCKITILFILQIIRCCVTVHNSHICLFIYHRIQNCPG